MWGIIGYNGFREANKVIIDCLKRLEYRGYDSAGIAVIGKKLQVFKEVGEISKLENKRVVIFIKQWKNFIISTTKANTHGL